MTYQATLTSAADDRRLAMLYQVSQTLGSSLDLTIVLNQVMDAIIQLTGAERGFLMLLDWATGQLELKVGRNVDQETIKANDMQVSRTVLRQVVEDNQAVVTSNAQTDPRFSDQSSVIGLALRSIMCAPLQTRGKTIGAVYVDNRIRTGTFSQDDLGMLAAFANQAAIAIENARLFTMIDQKLATRVQELSLMQQIDRELNTSLDLQRVMDLALGWAVKLADADSGMLALLEEDGDARVLASRGGDVVPDRLPPDHPIISQVLATRDIVFTHSPRLQESVDGTPAALQIVVPVKREERVIGLISLESNQKTPIQEDIVASLERLADRAAIAIENARLYDAVIAATEAKSRFISVVSHELRIPMTSIKGYTDMLKSGAAGSVNDMQLEFLHTIRRNVDRMNVLVSDLSDINRIEGGRLRLEPSIVQMADVMNESLAGLKNQFENKGQPVSVDLPPDLPAVWADRSRVVQIITNLLSNANKYSPNGRPVQVTADIDKVDGMEFVRLAVIDHGIGISAEDQSKLFTQFFRSDTPAVRNEVGWGLGLSIVKMLVEAQGGEVFVESELGLGSTFGFSLPVVGSS